MGRCLVSRLLRLVAEKGQDAGDWDGGLLTERDHRRPLRGRRLGHAQIAEALGITERTVKAHLSAVFEKLGVSDRLQLALLVHGISSPSESRSKIPPELSSGQYPGLRPPSIPAILDQSLNGTHHGQLLPPSSPNSPAAPGFAIATAR